MNKIPDWFSCSHDQWNKCSKCRINMKINIILYHCSVCAYVSEKEGKVEKHFKKEHPNRHFQK